uniref:Uncharacterized protein n=1 Tax=Glossina pallidipes TaxID=7398 RepID=A0A1A9ZMP9_GLOPL
MWTQSVEQLLTGLGGVSRKVIDVLKKVRKRSDREVSYGLTNYNEASTTRAWSDVFEAHVEREVNRDMHLDGLKRFLFTMAEVAMIRFTMGEWNVEGVICKRAQLNTSQMYTRPDRQTIMTRSIWPPGLRCLAQGHPILVYMESLQTAVSLLIRLVVQVVVVDEKSNFYVTKLSIKSMRSKAK